MISCLYCGLCIPVKRRSEVVTIEIGERLIHTKGPRIQNIPITETTTTKTIPTIRESVENRYRRDKDRIVIYYYSIRYLLCRGDWDTFNDDISYNPEWKNVKIIEKNGIIVYYLYPAGSSKPLYVSWYEVRNAKLEFRYYDILHSVWADYIQIRNFIDTEVKFTGRKFLHVNVLAMIPKSTENHPSNTSTLSTADIPITKTTTTKTIPTIKESVVDRWAQDKLRLYIHYYSIKYLLCRGDRRFFNQNISYNPEWKNVKTLEKNGIIIFYLYPSGNSKPIYVSWYEVRNAKLEFGYYDILYSTWADNIQIRDFIKTTVKFTGRKFLHLNVLAMIAESTENHPSNTSTSSTADIIKFTNVSKTTIVTRFSNKHISTTASTPLMETSAISDIKPSSPIDYNTSSNNQFLIKKEKQRYLKATFQRFLRRLAKLFNKTSKEI